jgi:hypothetical protein
MRENMEFKPQRRRIRRIILLTVFITALLVYTNFNFFIKIDVRENKVLNNFAQAQEITELVQNSERQYHVIYDENDDYSIEAKDSIIRVLNIVNIPYAAYDVRSMESFGESDYIILTVYNWEYFSKRIESVFEAVNNGASLLVTSILSFDDVYIANSERMGIKAFGGDIQADSLIIKDDIMLGLEDGDSFQSEMIQDDITVLDISDSARVYAEDGQGNPLFYTVPYGGGKIGIYNGYNINERNLDGLILGMIGSLEGEFIYPIINAGVMFIDDWPGPFKGDYDVISDQYGMSLDDFLKFVWWPDMVSFMKNYGVVYTGQYVHNYDDIITAPFEVDKGEFDIAMFYYGQQLIKNGCEIGLHGYNHQPLWFSEYTSEELLTYKVWGCKEDALEGLRYGVDSFKQVFPEYIMNCYVPPSNVIDDTGIEVVKEVMGTPVIIAGLYVGDPPETPQHEFEYKNDVIYFPRINSDSVLDDDMKISMASAMSMYGIISHFIHPDDVTDEERSRGLDWGSLRSEFEKILEFIEERYPYLEYMTATDAANNLINWQNENCKISYEEKSVTVTRNDSADCLCFILRTDKEVLDGEGYTYYRAGGSSYFVKVTMASATINLGGGS